MKKQLFVLFVFALFLFISCSENITSECEVCTDDANTGTVTTFATLQNDIFDQNCVSCHSGASAAGGLDLSPNVAYENLVNTESNGSSLKRVEPFNSSASYLYKVLDGSDAPLMPPSGRLSQAKIDSVQSWIDRGALND